MGDGINYMANTVGTHRVRPFVGNACPQMRVAHLFVIQQFTPPTAPYILIGQPITHNINTQPRPGIRPIRGKPPDVH